MNAVPPQPKIYHIAHVDRLPSIVATGGLLSDAMVQAQALGGTMIPVGDAKGAALALMVEILSATLTGANHAYEASSFFEPTGSAPGIGQTFILLDPKPLNPDFSARLEALCGHLLGQEGVRLPGERRFALRERNRISGVNLPEVLYNDLRKRAGGA